MKKAASAKPKKPVAAVSPLAEPAGAAATAPAKAKSSRKPKTTPLVVSPEPPKAITTIAARIDVGFGNALFLRGSGPGLDWEKGLPMQCLDGDLWTADVPSDDKPILFKFLVNDEVWSTGPDYVVDPGAQLEVKPSFS